MDDDIQNIVDEAKEGFDLDEVLTGSTASHDPKTIRVYTDLKTGEELGGADDVQTSFGTTTKERWGILGDIDLLREELRLINAVIDNKDELNQDAENLKTYVERRDEITAEIEELKAKAKPLQEKIEESALDIEVRYLPPIIVKDARKDARKHLGLKKVTEEDYEDYLAEFNAQILTRAATSITQVKTGRVNKQITIESARKMYGLLPSSEQRKLDEHIDKIVFKSKIAQHLALDADF